MVDRNERYGNGSKLLGEQKTVVGRHNVSLPEEVRYIKEET